MSPSAMSPEPAIGPAGSSIEQVAICGYMAQMCCDTTARQAFHLGSHVGFLSDATGTLSVQNSAGPSRPLTCTALCW